MARYNSPTAIQRDRGAHVVNRAGGEAHAQSPELALASLVLTSLVKQQAYRSDFEQLDDLRALVQQVDPVFAARAALYARHTHGLRSITHALAVELANHANKPWGEHVKGSAWLRPFIAAVVARPDDITEMLAYQFAVYGKPLPNALKAGLARAFVKFDPYQLAKYRGETRQVKLVDAVQLTHPTPTARNAGALRELVDGTLRERDTHESRLTEAGKTADGAADMAERREQTWGELVRSRKLGYLALLRNVRAIAKDAPFIVDEAAEQLTDPVHVKHAKLFPFQFLTAYNALLALPAQTERTRRAVHVLADAIADAAWLAVANVPVLPGKTLVAVDNSGSMGAAISGRAMPAYGEGESGSRVTCKDVAGLFAAALGLRNPLDVDILQFANTAQYVKGMDVENSIFENARKTTSLSGGTDFRSIFRTASRAYDRIVILSDMQAWVGFNTPAAAFQTYQQRHQCAPYVHSFDLTGYGDMQFPEPRVCALAGLSAKVFDIMALVETDPHALVNTINAVELPGAAPAVPMA